MIGSRSTNHCQYTNEVPVNLEGFLTLGFVFWLKDDLVNGQYSLGSTAYLFMSVNIPVNFLPPSLFMHLEGVHSVLVSRLSSPTFGLGYQ